MTSTKPVENQAIARAVVGLTADFEETKAEVEKKANATDLKADETGHSLIALRIKAFLDTLIM